MKKAQTAKDSRPPGAASAYGPALAIALAIPAVVYLIWFLWAAAPRQEGQLPLRLVLLSELRDPFGFVAQWFGPAGTPLGLLDRIPVVAMAGLILAAAYGLGRFVVHGAGSPDNAGACADRKPLGSADRPSLFDGDRPATLSELERSVFALGAGLSLLSTIVLLGGLAGVLLQRWLWWLIVAPTAGVGVWRLARDHWSRLCSWRSAFQAPRSEFRAPISALAWTATILSAVMLLGACLPPWDFDVLEYHLQVPKEWLQQGRVTFLPHNVYGNMPLGAEMHALLAMALWPGGLGWFYGALAGKLVIASHSIVTALGLAAAGERLASKWAGLLAACLYLAHPWVMQVSTGGLNDGALACYVFLSAYALWLARRGACGYWLPGLLAGAAAACKYPGLVLAVAPLAIWTLWPTGGPRRPRAAIAALALYLIGVLVGGGAWYLKNAALARNPVYPLAYSVFDGRTRTPEKHAQWQRAHQVPPDAQGRRYSPRQLAGALARIAGRDDLASPLVVPLLAIYMVTLVNPKSKIQNPKSTLPFALLLTSILATWWLLSHRIDRFLLPAWPFAALLAAIAVASLDGGWPRRVVLAFVAIGLAWCLVADCSTLVGDNRWFVSLEQLRRDRPWPTGTPLRVKAEHQWLNENIPPGQAVLLVGDAAPFDLEMPVYYNTCFDDCLLCDWTLGKSAGQQREELASRRIAWVLVDWPEIARYQQPGNYEFDPRFSPELIEELVRQQVLGPPEVLRAQSNERPPELYPVGEAGAKQPPAAGVP